MDTIIDTNIIRRDLKLKDKNFDILIDYLGRTNSRLILPSIVLEEVKGLYKRALQERFEEYTKSIEKLKSTLLFLEMPETPALDINGDADKYIEYIHKRFGTSADNIIEYKNEYLPELVKRAIERKKPLDNKGQQFRDGLLWLTLLDYAQTTDEKQIAFISDNPTDFSEKGDSNLSNELLEETKEKNVVIKYFRTINDFAKQHASAISFITREWVEENIDFSITEKLFVEILGEKQERAILGDLDLERHEQATGYIIKTDYIGSNLIDFFVYEKSDGTILLNIEMQFEFEYEIEIERMTHKEITRYDYRYRTNPQTGEPEMDMLYIPDYDIEHEYDYKYDYPVFRGKFVISINDKKIGEYELKDWEWWG